MSLSPANTYYLCFPRKQEVLAWNPFALTAPLHLSVRTAYFSGVFQAMEKHLRHTGLTFYLTPSVHALPAYGPDIVAVIDRDEQARIPMFFDKVRATFKCYGTEPARPPRLLAQPSYLNLLTHARDLRDRVHRLPGRMHATRRRHRKGVPPIYTIPLGYANQLALPLKPFEERETDLFFAGSVTHKNYPAWSPKRWLRTPKDLSRTRMLAALEQARQDLPTLKVDLQMQSSFRRSIEASAAAYSARMMNARICLAPRGASFETYRLYEAMRYGCVAITETLPLHWFYEDAPSFEVTDWSELPALLAHLLNDPDLLRTRHAATLAWWETRCSEAAVGRYMAEQLNRLAAPSPPTRPT